jgi:hypothetical protein
MNLICVHMICLAYIRVNNIFFGGGGGFGEPYKTKWLAARWIIPACLPACLPGSQCDETDLFHFTEWYIQGNNSY